jgi:5-methylcytosine-specific restriction enzyme subunit McrC
MTLLFDMGDLFEKYVGRLLCRALAGTDREVVLQGGRLFCLTTGGGLFQTKPDILIRQADVITHVIDTKWKKLCRPSDDAKHGVSQSDIYQMMAYAQIYGAPRVILLYPHHAELGAGEGVHASHGITGHHATIAFASLDVSQPGDISARLRGLLGFEPSAPARAKGGAPGAGGEAEAGAEVLAQGGG